MARSRGRRTAIRERRTPVAPAKRRHEPKLTTSSLPRWGFPVLVLVSLAALINAGIWSRPAGTPTQLVTGTGTIEHTMVCGGGITGAQSITSATPTTPVISQPISADKPTVVRSQSDQSEPPVAAQWAASAKYLALAPCPEPRADWWFVGIGGAQTHPATLLLDNPRSGAAVVDVRAFNATGLVDAPGLRGIRLPAGSRQLLDLRQEIPSATDLAVQVVATRGLVSVTAIDQWSSSVIGSRVSDWVPGQPQAAADLVLTGLPDQPQQATLLVVNPRDTETIVKVRAIGASGTFTPQGATSLSVPAQSLASLDLKTAFDGNPLAFRLSSESPVSATIRAVQHQDLVYGQVASVLEQAAIGVPPGSQGQVLLSSLGRSGVVQVRFFDRTGQQIGTEMSVSVAAATTSGVDLPANTAAIRLRSKAATHPEGIVAGLSVTRGRGLAGVAFPVPRSLGRPPAVLPGW